MAAADINTSATSVQVVELSPKSVTASRFLDKVARAVDDGPFP